MAMVRLLAVVNGKQRQIEVDFDTLGKPKVYTRALTEEEVAQGFLTLEEAPINPTSATLVWLGVPQTYGVDFQVEEDRLIFLPSFSGHVEAGDFITVQI